MRNGCKCGGKLFVTSIDYVGHCIEVALQCMECGHSVVWSSSAKFGDGSYEYNREMALAWLLSGGEIQI